MKIAIDSMGGDNAPQAVIEGVKLAVESIADLEIVLVGDEAQIKPHLSDSKKISIIHTTEIIEGTDEPVKAVRRKKQSSMVLMIQEVKEKRADAAISAGNTGALMAAGLFGVGRIKGIARPALAPTLPTRDGKGFLFLDVGSNMDAKPEHLLQYAIMGNTYSEKVLNVNKPRIGLLNIGTEPGKGNELSKEAFALLKKAPFNFVGNVESRDLLEGVADVVVCDGFSGNLVLKTIEGTALSLFSMIKTELTSSFMSKLGAGLLKSKFSNIKNALDYSEYGGAALFGLAAPIIKAHGSSNGQAIYSAIKQAAMIVEKEVVPTIENSIKVYQEV